MRMKLNLSLLFLFAAIFEIKGQITFDTVETTNVGIGIVYRRIIAPAVPWSINELEIDLKNPSTSFETVKANDKLYGQETVRSMAARHSYGGHTVVGAINGDFYNIGPGTPINIQISRGEIIRGPINRPAFGIDVYNFPMVDVVNYSGTVIDKGSSIFISGVNTERGTDQMILYNHYFGSSTGTNAFGTEISIKALNPWLANDTIHCVVLKKENGVGSMEISDTSAVLSGHGTSKAFLDNNVNVGDTIKVINRIIPGLTKLKEMIGGGPKIVEDGKNLGDMVSREPRTAVGFNQDSTKLYLFTIDGRQLGFSLGMTFHELADLMISCGVYTGLNLDGGGSTTMVIRDSVVNSPSDGAERKVSNGFLVITNADQKGNLNSVQVSPDYFKLFPGESVQFKLSGFDEFYNPVAINSADVQYSLSHNFGSLTSDGFFTAGDKIDTGYVFAEYSGLRDSAMIIIKGISAITIVPKNIVTDTIRIQQFKVRSFDSEGVERFLSLTDFNWSLSDSSIGIIDSAGNFKGTSSGTTEVIASLNDVSDTSLVEVVIKKGYQIIDAMDNSNNWVFSPENLDPSSSISISNNELTQGSGSIKLDYKFTYDPTKVNYIYLDTNYPFAGVPDSIFFDGKSDGRKHLVTYVIEDDNQEQFRVPVKKYFEISDRFDIMGAAFNNAAPVSSGSLFNFPVTLKRIEIKLASTRHSGEVYSGTLYLDNLRISYPIDKETSVEKGDEIPKDFYLSQNYPNPFNPTTTIIYTIPQNPSLPKRKTEEFVSLKVYDILGREVATLVNEEKMPGNYKVIFDARSYRGSKLASGIYFYRIDVGNPLSGSGGVFSETKKMILLK